ncbi:MAG: hypothetical protein M1827_004516 [Pycnora praestabilis]|nr:MAG: hypothetical protein M1827_004516 [Pycnora praestabilis]
MSAKLNHKLIPKNPSESTVIRNVTPNIITCSAPFNRFGQFKVGGRGTIVRLSSGALAVFSPTELTPEVRSALNQLGNNVRYITALDAEHHIFLGPWHAAFPNAKVLGPESLPEKRASQKVENVPFAHVFTRSNKNDMKIDAEFDADFEYEYLNVHPNKELVFNYKPDRTLIEADALFNLPATEQYSRSGETATSGFLTRLFVGLMSAQGPATWQKRFLWYAASASDRNSFNESARRIDKFDFDRIIPCHGDVIESNGKGIFRNVYEWHLNGKH